jgi:uncharacterized protein involved in exopolysaccharide biosynthesis
MSSGKDQPQVKKLAKTIEEAIDRFERDTATQVSAIRLTRQAKGAAKIMIYSYGP